MQLSDLYSRTVTAGIFEGLLTFDYLARPFQMKPLTAQEMPEISSDFTRFTFRIRPGIMFADDPAFGGKPRELTAHDYVYSFKRHYDPKWKSPNLYLLENAKLLGLSELRKSVTESKKPFPYDQPVEGVKALDRYTLQFNLAEPSPRFHQQLLTDSSAFGAVAREVVERYGDKIMEHPVGTGPFRLAEWRRSSRIVLERNPAYRDVRYDAQAPANDARSQAIAARLAGRRLPLLDRVEIAIIEETQPRWLSFLNGQSDFLERLPAEFSEIAIPNAELAPNLRRQGVQMDRGPLVDATLASLFNQDHPVIGGYTPDKVALRRAISLAYNAPDEIRLIRKNQAVPAQGPDRTAHLRLPARREDRDERLRPGARQGAARPVRLCRPRRRRLARPARRQAAGARVRHPARPAEPPVGRAVGQEHEGGGHPHDLQGRQVAREPEGLARRQADDVGRGLERAAAPTAIPSWRWATAPTRARPTTPASTCRPSTRSTSSRTRCPTAPSASG